MDRIDDSYKYPVIVRPLYIMQLQENTHNISVSWRGKKFVVEMNSGATLKELGDKLLMLSNVKADTLRLIVPQSSKSSKLLYPFSDEHSGMSLAETSSLEGKSIRMMGAPQDEVDEVLKNAQANLRIAGFEEEEKRLRLRILERPLSTLKLPQGSYIFCEFRTLQLPGIQLNPPASEALKRMHMLAADPGIVAIMNKHRWQVGIMTEMAPVGYVGVSPKCILGFNKNHGEEISLRLRTDDLKGFRKYESIKKTLLHELAHMVYSEHDENFYALDKQLNQEAEALDWTRSKGHTLTGVRHSVQYEELFLDNQAGSSQKLGGTTSDQLTNARETSVAAAYHRFAKASLDPRGSSNVHQEPNPGDVEFGVFQQPDSMDVDGIGKLSINNPTNAPLDSQNRFEPDPDDTEGGHTMESEEYSDSGVQIIISEPDPDDSLSKKTYTYKEPDPDDSEGYSDSGVQIIFSEPDPDDSLSKKTNTYKEPDPDDSGAFSKYKDALSNAQQINILDEPDPDDCEPNLEEKRNGHIEGPYQGDILAIKSMESKNELRTVDKERDPVDNLVGQRRISATETNEHDLDDQELLRIQDPVTVICNRLQKAIQMLQSEVDPLEASGVLQTLFKIIRNLIEHPSEMKFKRIRKANPIIQRNVVKYKAAMEFLLLVGFNEDVVWDEIGNADTYLVLKRNDPGLLWLAKSSLETCIA
ncbi:hypothetical protein NMG60_11003177 [Bertholletia excelsa]